MKLARVSSAALLAVFIACSDPPPDPVKPIECAIDPRASLYAPGFSKMSATGLFRARIEQTSPPIPGTGLNVWELQLLDANGTATTASIVRLKASRPDEDGTAPLSTDAVLLPVSGRYRVGPFALLIDGLWEITIEATIDGTTDDVRFAFCIEDRVIEDAGVVVADASAPIECTVTAPTACPAPPIRYADVEPIIAERCLSCHDGRGEQWPLNSYGHAADWFDEIRSMILACTMPPPEAGIPMTNAERETILLWVRCGFPP